jgi:farnesyl diphosphate synthase
MEKGGPGIQVADDILDQTAPGHLLGKTPGKDSASDKATYVKLLGLEAARRGRCIARTRLGRLV